MDFYHDLAPFYDQMISFSERIDQEIKIFQAILDKYPAKTALDAGCGSGFHSILLAKLGLKVTGIDISDDMLNLAHDNARKYQTAPLFVRSDFLTMSSTFAANFDAIFCLGNSFVHLLTPGEQLRALNNFKDRLTDKGYLCLQIVNYDKFLYEKREELSVKRTGDKVFTRTYDYHDDKITFNVQVEEKGKTRKMSTELFPLRYDELASRLKEAGFDKLQVYGTLKLDPYQPLISENCCLFCSNTSSPVSQISPA